MTPERFRAIVDAYGTEPRRWPQAERLDAQEWARVHHAESRAMLGDAAPLDNVLAGYTLPPAGAALFERILAGAPRLPFWRRGRVWWSSAVFAGFGLAGGLAGAFAVSFYMMTMAVPHAHDEPWMTTAFGSSIAELSDEGVKDE
jgi:hypothetical protein